MVAISTSGTVATDINVTSVTTTVNATGTNRVSLVCLQLIPGNLADSPTGVSLTWDYGGTNQAMTLIDDYTTGGATGAVHLYMFGIVGIPTGTKTVRAAWTNPCDCLIHASTWQSANQVSVAAAFTNVSHASANTTDAQVTVASVAGNIVAGHFSTDQVHFTTISDSTLFPIQSSWGLTNSYESAGAYKAGAASVTLHVATDDAFTWFAQAVNIAAPAPGVIQISAAFAGAGARSFAARPLLAMTANLSAVAGLSINTLRQNWLINPAAALAASGAALASVVKSPLQTLAQLNASAGLSVALGQNWRVAPAAALAGSAAVLTDVTKIPRQIAAALAAVGSVPPTATIILVPLQILAQLDAFGGLGINSLGRNWLVASAAALNGSAAVDATLKLLTAWPAGAQLDGRGALFNQFGQIKFIPTSAVLAGAGNLLAPRLALPKSIAAALAATAAMSQVAPYSITFWSGAAALSAAATLQVEVQGRSLWTAAAALAAEAVLYQPRLGQSFAVRASLAASAAAVMAFVSSEANVSPFSAGGSLQSDSVLIIGGRPPEVLLLWDREREPDGSLMQQVIVSNWNSAIALEADYGLVGNSQGGRGPAERIRLIPPLFLSAQELSIDQSDIYQRLLWLEDYTEALNGSLSEALDRIAELEAVNATVNAAARLTALEAINAASRLVALEAVNSASRIAALETQLGWLISVSKVKVFSSSLAGSGRLVANLT
jgi:hypothetical protein